MGLSKMKRKFIGKILLNTAILVGGVMFLTWFLEYRYFLGDAEVAFNFMTERPRVFFYNALIMALFMGVMYAIFWKPFSAVSVLWAIIIIVSYIHINKYTSRGTPLLPEDFQLADQAGALMRFTDVGALVRMILAVVLTVWLGRFLDRKTAAKLQFVLPEKLPWWLKRMAVPRIGLVVMMVGVFVISTDFVRNHAGIAYERIDFLDTTLTAWNQNRNYDENGFILGFLYNLQKVSLDEPEDYSEDKIAEIHEEYAEKKAADTERTKFEDADYNVVIILNESFYDPEVLSRGGVYDFTGGDVTPNWHRIMQENPSGYMYSTEYGGGTANVEFEAFTGLSNYWADTVPYTDIFPKLKRVASVASFLKKSGYETLALHPFNGGMYKRNLALPVEGYDEFVDLSGFDFTEHEGNSQYVNDRSSYEQTLKALRENDSKQMIELVTMQNHLPYNHDIYEKYDFSVTGVSDGEREDIETYLQLLHNSDRYLGDFLEELDALDEKTVVMFFGDHSPGIFQKASKSEDADERNLAQLTPYFIHANFELDGEVGYEGAKDIFSSVVKNTTLPTTTPNCLSNTLYNILGAEKPDFEYLMDEVCGAEPILSRKYNDNEEESDSEATDKYKLLVYDTLGGSQFWE